MANRKAYIMILFMFAFNLLVAGTNEMELWEGDMDYYDMNTESINTTVKELTNVDDIEKTDESGLSYFDIPGMIIKSLKILILATAAIPLIGGLLYSYGVPLEICAVFQSINIVILAYLYLEFASNRSASR